MKLIASVAFLKCDTLEFFAREKTCNTFLIKSTMSLFFIHSPNFCNNITNGFHAAFLLLVSHMNDSVKNYIPCLLQCTSFNF